MDRLREMELFVRVVETGSFSAAARDLKVGQPAISKAIGGLEDRHGAGAGLEGRLRICSPVTFARLHLVPKLGAFLDAHPKLRLELVMDDRPVDLVAESIDAGLRLGTLTDSALRARKLAQTDRVVVASPAYLARRGVPNTPADLLDHDGIIYGQSSGGQEWLFRRGTSKRRYEFRPG
jgi:DNA-binding transcriptional LysR family regulator